MTIEARINLQKGVPEDKRFSNTDYTSDGSTLDTYLLSKARFEKEKKMYLEKRKAKEEQAKMNESLKEEIKNLLEHEFKELFK